ncbi:MAG: tRNA uridine-5-carboxymethylaminomethyl(34) synthesis GTPase MnmE [Gammaproteobacteria bacterium]|nr:tRNA uridine-5-carboxymethylaminomethyl(34) synthesis GTPase MnmE [Gammaproteobacteria bacterium]
MTAATDTIVAVATPPGRGGIGVIRVSGPASALIAQSLTGRTPVDRQARFTAFRDAGGGIIDQGLGLYFAGPRSFTGEDVFEIHAHGSPVILDLLVKRAIELGARPAQAGEFSQRAFLNGKIDLAQAEAIADLINSSTVEAARSANRTLEGVLSDRVSVIRDAIVHIRTRYEATIDFTDDLPSAPEPAADPAFDVVIHRIREVLEQGVQGRVLSEGVKLVIAGPPNAGKSSLINRLSGYDSAIVSAIAGTTRDVVRESINLDGIPLHIVDTAGLQDTADPVELMGIERTHQEVQTAQILLYVIDGCVGPTPADESFLAGLPETLDRILIMNKADLTTTAPPTMVGGEFPMVALSALTGQGLECLREEIKSRLHIVTTEGLFFANRRHLAALETALGHICRGRDHGVDGTGVELMAEELRLAQEALAEITGAFTTDDLLGSIFSTFCIGK